MPWQLFLEQFNGIVASVFCEVNRYEACDLHGIARKFPSLHDAEVWLAVLTESGSWVASGHSRCQHPQLCVNMLTRSALSLQVCLAWTSQCSMYETRPLSLSLFGCNDLCFRHKTIVFSKLQALRFPNISATILRMFRLFPCPLSPVSLRFIDAVTGAAVKHSVVTVYVSGCCVSRGMHHNCHLHHDV